MSATTLNASKSKGFGWYEEKEDAPSPSNSNREVWERGHHHLLDLTGRTRVKVLSLRSTQHAFKKRKIEPSRRRVTPFWHHDTILVVEVDQPRPLKPRIYGRKRRVHHPHFRPLSAERPWRVSS